MVTKSKYKLYKIFHRILAGKMTELEQRWQQLLSGTEDNSEGHEEDEEYGYAPSQLLLNGYCAAMVDDVDISSIPSIAPDNEGVAITPDPGDSRKPKSAEALHSDDGMSSLSTESVDSSVYEVDVQPDDFQKSSSATTDSGNCGLSSRCGESIFLRNDTEKRAIFSRSRAPLGLQVGKFLLWGCYIGFTITYAVIH